MDKARQTFRIIPCLVILLALGIVMQKTAPRIRSHIQSAVHQVEKISTEMEAYILSLYKHHY